MSLLEAEEQSPQRLLGEEILGHRLGSNGPVVQHVDPVDIGEDLQRVLSSVRDGGYVSFMVYNLDLEQTRIVNLRVGR